MAGQVLSFSPQVCVIIAKLKLTWVHVLGWAPYAGLMFKTPRHSGMATLVDAPPPLCTDQVNIMTIHEVQSESAYPSDANESDSDPIFTTRPDLQLNRGHVVAYPPTDEHHIFVKATGFSSLLPESDGSLDSMGLTIEVADMNNDQILDIIVAESGPNRVQNRGSGNPVMHPCWGMSGSIKVIFYNAGRVESGTLEIASGAFSVRDIEIVDIDGDGDLDVLASSSCTNNMLLVNDGIQHINDGRMALSVRTSHYF